MLDWSVGQATAVLLVFVILLAVAGLVESFLDRRPMSRRKGKTRWYHKTYH